MTFFYVNHIRFYYFYVKCVTGVNICIQAWRPYRKKDIDTLNEYRCVLTTIETRRLRGDQIEVLKIFNGYENIDRNMFFLTQEG